MARRYGRYTAETTHSDFNTNPKKCYFFTTFAQTIRLSQLKTYMLQMTDIINFLSV